MSLTTSYSLWLLPLCIALGVLCAWLLYRRTTEQHGWSKPLQWVLGTARALVIPGATARWTFGLRGYVIVFKRNGGRAFNLGIQLEDFYDFVELIEPGSSAKREPKHNPDSWWNRELFK